MVKEEYEFVPTHEFNKLSSELQGIKDNPFLSKTQSKDMKVSIDDLNGSVKGLLELMKLAHQDMSMEEREEKIMKKHLEPIIKRFDTVEENQETIANGVLLVSESVTKLAHKIDHMVSELQKAKPKPAPVEKPESKRTTVTKKVYTSRSTPQVGLPQFQQFSNSQLPPTVGPDGLPPFSSSSAIQTSATDGYPPQGQPMGTAMPPPAAATPPPAPEPKKHGLFGRK